MEGPWGDLLEPILVQMNFSRLYDPKLGHLAHTVSRTWCSPGTIQLFCWDSSSMPCWQVWWILRPHGIRCERC